MYTYAANNTLILLDTNGLYYEYAQDSGRIGWYQDDNINNREEFSIGYAGKGTGINNPSMQGQGDSARGDTNFGPLGTGTYEMEFRESYTGTDSAGKKTNYKNVLLLFQDGDYTGKMIHGEGVTKEGKFDSSKGCIVTFDGKPAGVRKEMHNSGDNILKVVEHARDSEKMSYGQSRDQEKYRGAAAANAYNER